MRAMIFCLLIGLGMLASGPVSAQVDAIDSTSNLVENQQVEPSFITRTILYVQSEQQRLHRALAGAIRTLRAEGSAAAAWGLISLSFLYGLFHAAGPGHGKAVLSTYLLTQPTAMRRSLLLAAASSFMQGLTAIIIVVGIVSLFGLALRSSGLFVQWLEAASFALVGLVGLWLVWRSARALAPQFGFSFGADSHHHHHHSHDHGHDHEHGHDHDHVHDEDCGHVHFPTPQQATQASSLREMVGIVLSIGIRPCSGAILVLVFAQAVGMTVAGIAAVLAMSAGTALAVALIALVAVGARDAAWTITRLDDTRIALAVHGLAIVGGLLLVVFGLLFAFASATQPASGVLLM